MLTIGFNSFKWHSQLSKHTNQFQFNGLETGIVVISVFSDDSRMEQPDFMVIVKGSLVDSVQACEFAGGVERFWHIRFARFLRSTLKDFIFRFSLTVQLLYILL